MMEDIVEPDWPDHDAWRHLGEQFTQSQRSSRSFCSGTQAAVFPPPLPTPSSFRKPGSIRFTHSWVVHPWEASVANHVSQMLRGGGGVFRNVLDPAGCHQGSACIWSRLIIESAATVIKVANHTTPLKHKFSAAVVLRNYPYQLVLLFRFGRGNALKVISQGDIYKWLFCISGSR